MIKETAVDLMLFILVAAIVILLWVDLLSGGYDRYD